MRNKIAVLLATWFYVGRMKKAPGTWGTLATIPLCALLHWVGPFYQMGFAVILLPFAIWAADTYDNLTGGHDSKEIVVDEVLGFIITMAWLPFTWQAYLIGFVVFRCLDILKPFPISYFDRKVKGGTGVVADDVVAGIIGNILLQVVFVNTAYLGYQWGGS